MWKAQRVSDRAFYLAGNWVIPSQGRGMVIRPAEACWRMLTDPEHTSITDVNVVFFEDCKDRYFHGGAPAATPSLHASQWGEDLADQGSMLPESFSSQHSAASGRRQETQRMSRSLCQRSSLVHQPALFFSRKKLDTRHFILQADCQECKWGGLQKRSSCRDCGPMGLAI